MTTALPVLVSIPASNYTVPLGGTSVPLLSLPDRKTALCDSSDILDFCAKSEPSLYSNKDIKFHELYYDKELGPATRIVAYYFAFKDSSLARDVLISPVASLFERVIGTIFFPLLRFLLLRFMAVNDTSVFVAVDKIEPIIHDANERLGDGPMGSRFLAGGSFSAADISFCAHLGILLAPPQNVYLRSGLKLVETHPLGPRIEALQQIRAAEFVRWCYEHKRVNDVEADRSIWIG